MSVDKKIVTLEDLKEGLNILKQEFYDEMFPVDYEHTGITCIGVPTGVTATWTEQTELNNRYPVVLSTSAVKRLLAEELPNVNGFLGYYYGTTEQNAGAFKDTYSGMSWLKPQMTSDYGPNNRIDFYANKGQVDSSKAGGYRSQAESTYKDNGVVRPLSYTVKHWKRTA